MQLTRRFMVLFAYGLFMLLAFYPQVTLAQEVDKTGQILSRARVKYEYAMATLRRGVDRRAVAAIDKASKANAPVDAIFKAQTDLDDFRTLGKLPKNATQDRWMKEYAKASGAMSKAYARAIAGYAKSGEDRLQLAVIAEAEQFGNLWDLVPWRPSFTEGMSAIDRSIMAGGALTFENDLSGEYRIEVKARRIGDAGTLSINLPLANGQRLILPAITNDDGDVRVILTVREDHVSADLGVDRPIDLNESGTEESYGLVISSEDAAFVILLVRVKPLIAGEPPSMVKQTKAKTGKRKRAKKSNTPAQTLPLGSKWSGKVYGQSAGARVATVSVIKNEGDLVVLAVKDIYGTSHWILRVNGNSFRVFEILPKTGKGVQVKNVQGSGTVRNGRLRWNGRWTWQKARAGGSVNAYLDVSRDD